MFHDMIYGVAAIAGGFCIWQAVKTYREADGNERKRLMVAILCLCLLSGALFFGIKALNIGGSRIVTPEQSIQGFMDFMH